MAGIAPKIHRIVTLSSGKSRGTNLMAIYRYFKHRQLPIQIAKAIFTDASSMACIACAELGIPKQVISIRDIDRFEEDLLAVLKNEKVELLALCGFMKLLSASFISQAAIPILNVHPALLPKYGGKKMYGMAVHRAVFEARELNSGATIHRVDSIYDHGEILTQKAVDISHCQSPEEIASTVLKVEHEIYPRTIYEFLTKA